MEKISAVEISNGLKDIINNSAIGDEFALDDPKKIWRVKEKQEGRLVLTHEEKNIYEERIISNFMNLSLIKRLRVRERVERMEDIQILRLKIKPPFCRAVF